MEVLQRTANRGSISTGFNIDNSLKIERANSEKLARTPSSASNSKTWTYSFWLKRTQLGINSYHLEAKGTGDKFFIFGFNENDQILFYDIFSGDYGKAFTRRFRDTGAWYHIVLRADTTDGTASNRMRLYVNGVQETTVTSDYGDFPQNHDTQINKAVVHNIGYRTDINQYASGYIAETCLIDGTSLGPDSFGEFDSDTGIWKPIDVSDLTFGTNGFYQDYKTGADLGADKVSGGNSNDYTETNITAADQATDTPTNNFCTLNPLALDGSVGSSGNITQGATKATATEFDVYITFAPTFGVTSGKWYAEFEYEGSQADNLVGILDIDAVVAYNSFLGKAGAWSVGLYQANGKLYVTSDSGTTSTASWGASAADGDIISVAVDMDNHFVYFAKNGTYQNSGVPTSGATGTGGVAFDSNKTVGIGCSSYDQGGDEGQIFANYGGFTAGTISSGASDGRGHGTFEYAPPSGYFSLCTKNLSELG